MAIEKSISGVQASNTASTSAFTFFREPSVVQLKKWPNERGKKQLVMVGGGSQGGEKAWQQFFLMPDKKLEKKTLMMTKPSESNTYTHNATCKQPFTNFI